MKKDDEEIDALMARLAVGDRSVFSAVFKRLWTPVRRLCLGLLKNEADASDAAQEAMKKILERASDYDRKRPAAPWALAIAAWECRTLQRRRLRRREISDEAAEDQRGEHPEEALVNRDLAEAALMAMGELSETDKQTLLATFLDEVAPTTGATFRKRRERALVRLRTVFRSLYGLG